MFVVKYDKHSMVKLVRAISKYPSLFDTITPYSKDEMDKCWDKVALEVGEKDSLCREKWHSIKSCYVRHLKYSTLNSKRKPYYLAEYLDFLMPYVSDKIRKFIKLQTKRLDMLPTYLKEVLPSPEHRTSYLTPNCLIEQKPIVKSEMIDVEELSESDSGSVSSDQPSSSKISYESTELEDASSFLKKLKASNKSDQCEELAFFKNIISDIDSMSDHQKLKFKQEVLSIVEDILYAVDDVH